MQVKDLMSKDMVFASPSSTVFDVAKMMKNHNIGCVPVVADGEKVLGVVTDRDIVLNIAKYNLDTTRTLASTIMSDRVFSVRPGADIEDALALMKKQQIRRLPVIEDECLMGMISIGDIAVTNDYSMETSETLTEISKPAELER
ncbi:MAG: CBS domain-containing protein [Clostridia bacterium]|nr:CBS domain-containing protein [Clostridia bacterium]